MNPDMNPVEQDPRAYRESNNRDKRNEKARLLDEGALAFFVSRHLEFHNATACEQGYRLCRCSKS